MPMELATEPQPFQNLSRQASKMMEQMQKGFFYPGETWQPSVNLYETANSYLVCVDLAGVEKDKIDVEVADHRLKLRGAREVPTYDGLKSAAAHEKVRIHLMEIDHGSFSREVELPVDADRRKISAAYRNGMLWIEIPKA